MPPQIPTAKQGELPPGFTSITDWNQFFRTAGLEPFENQIQRTASQGGLSREDAAYRLYYGLPLSGAGYGQTAPVVGGFTQGPEQREVARREQFEAIRPAVESLQAQIPETQAKFATERGRLTGEVEPLKQRYQTLLDDLTRRETRETEATQLALAREFGRRGIPQSSGLAEQTGLERTQPISQFYGIQQREAVGERESGLRQLQNLITGLTPQETEATRAIRNAIAQMQAGAGQSAIQQAMQQLTFQEQQRQAQAGESLAQQKFDYEKTLAKAEDLSKKYATLAPGAALINLLTGQPIYTNPKTKAGITGDTTLNDLFNQFGGE